VCEFFNSAIENIANVVSPDFNEQIKQVKIFRQQLYLSVYVCRHSLEYFVFGKVNMVRNVFFLYVNKKEAFQ
jgi:hypothetical protein